MIKDKSIFIKNVYYMLSYAFQDLRPDREDDVAGEDFERIHDLFASILAKASPASSSRASTAST